MSDSQRTIDRILDAAGNRAAEGMRTIEEFVRFVRDDSDAAAAAKQLRHGLAEAMSRFDRARLVSARAADDDVGATLEGSGEYHRVGIADVITAAAERVQQSLRVLEEYGKTVDLAFARQIETLRYRAYSLHREVELAAMRHDRHARLDSAVLYLLIDGRGDPEPLGTALRRLAAAGVDVFQLRDKHASDRELYQRAELAARVSRECGTLFIVNDRVDIALATDADGVHVGQDELDARVARRLLGDQRIVGVSTHSMTQVHQAIAAGADYIGCGPTFPSRTKAFDTHAGVDFLKKVHEQTRAKPRPAFAIGGIDHDNLDQVLDCGFHRIAVTAAIHQAPDPAAAARALRAKLVSQASPRR